MENKSPRILVVDDEPDILEFIQYNLNKEGYETDVAENGKDAIEKAKSFDPHLILLDIMMPKKDGFTLAQEIRSQDKKIPIIFLTAKSLKEDTKLLIKKKRH